MESAFVNGNEATIHLKELIEGNAQRFMFNRTTREWDWQMGEGSFPDDRWYSLKSHATPEKPKRNADLDDEIPF